MLLPLGRALSNGSLGRASRLSCPSAVKKNPPCSRSSNSAIIRSVKGSGLAQPTGVAGRGVEPDQAVGQEGVILKIGGQLGLALAIGPQQPAVGRAELVEQEVGGLLGGLAIFLDLEDPEAVGIRGDHQPVPGGQDLVVAHRRGPLLAGRQQPGAERREPGLQLFGVVFERLGLLGAGLRLEQDIAASLEVGLAGRGRRPV